MVGCATLTLFFVCCASLLDGYWFLVPHFGSGSRLVAKNVLLSRSQLHNQLIWCSHLWVVHSPVCVTKSHLLCAVVGVGDKLLVEQVW